MWSFGFLTSMACREMFYDMFCNGLTYLAVLEWNKVELGLAASGILDAGLVTLVERGCWFNDVNEMIEDKELD